MIGNQIAGFFSVGTPPAPASNFESIATVTVGSGGSSSITFSSIPSTYKHLQIRVFAQETRATYGIADISMTFNSDTAANYSVHGFYGDGSGVSQANNISTQSSITFGEGTIGTTTGGTFGVAIVDILDYANTNKYKTTRTLTGVDINGTIAGYGGRVGAFVEEICFKLFCFPFLCIGFLWNKIPIYVSCISFDF
jgi:hypothetical protein